MLKKFNVLTIVYVESDRLICVSVSHIIALLIIILWLIISLACFERDLTLWTRIIIVLSKIILLFNIKINHFLSVVYTQVMHFYLLLLQIFWISLYNKYYHKFLPYWVQYIFGLDQMIFAFADQNQQCLVLNVNPAPYEH